MKINRDLCVGQILLGCISQYDEEEIVKYNSIQYISKVLKKKNFSLKNGTEKERLFSNERYVISQISKVKKNQKKAQAIAKEAIRHVKSKEHKLVIWGTHSKISNEAWARAVDAFKEDNAITVSALILAILRKSKGAMKFYGFNQKKLDKFINAHEFGQTHLFASSRVASKILSNLDEEIAHHIYNQKDN